MEDKNLNLDNPIFVVYLNTENLSTSYKDEMIKSCQSAFSYGNATFWYICDNFSKIECVWKGRSFEKMELSDLVEKINKRLNDISNSDSLEELKTKIRDLKLEDILE